LLPSSQVMNAWSSAPGTPLHGVHLWEIDWVVASGASGEAYACANNILQLFVVMILQYPT